MGPFKQLYRNTYCNRCGSVLPETGEICPYCHEEVGYYVGDKPFVTDLKVYVTLIILGIIFYLIVN